MDICLNVSCGPKLDAEKVKVQGRKKNFFKPHVKRLMKKSFKEKKNKDYVEAKNDDGKIRIKQKSLASIVAKNVARSKITALKKLDESSLTKNKPIVEFTKSTNENELKTILAKRRKIDDDKTKKSLSTIFSTSDDVGETKLLRDKFEKFSHAKNLRYDENTKDRRQIFNTDKNEREKIEKSFEKFEKFSNKKNFRDERQFNENKNDRAKNFNKKKNEIEKTEKSSKKSEEKLSKFSHSKNLDESNENKKDREKIFAKKKNDKIEKISIKSEEKLSKFPHSKNLDESNENKKDREKMFTKKENDKIEKISIKSEEKLSKFPHAKNSDESNENKKDREKIFPKKENEKIEKISKKSEENLEKFPHARNIIISESQNQSNKKNFKKKTFNNEKFVNSESVSKSSKTPSKVSSLFGNNPEVPKIGQRLVKPVNESLFSKTSFTDLGIHNFAVTNLHQNMNIKNMTTVQQKAIPIILSGKNVLVRSQTGSGKTLAYALPIVENLQKIRPKLMRNSGLKALVVVPTRELALQTYEFFLKLVKPFTWIVPGYLVGGEKRKAEKARLRRGCTILIATPGRLLDHILHTKALKLIDVKYFVLDEADRMLDMGYERDISDIVDELKKTKSEKSKNDDYDPLELIRNNGKKNDEKIIDEKLNDEIDNEENNEDDKREYHSGTDSDYDEEEEFSIGVKKKKNSIDEKKSSETIEYESHLDSTRQTILLSATLTSAVEKLAGLTMIDPIFVDAAEDNLTKIGGNLNDVNEDLVVPEGVLQSYVVTPPKLRMVTLSAYIAGKCQIAGQHKILVFMATQDMIDYHAEILSKILGKPRDDDDEDSEPLVDVEFFKLHGSMSQKERTEVFKTFRKARSGVLLCTDVASRGLDMPKVDTVVQYTGPLSARDYVHRIGRTARAGTSGVSTIFLTPPEIDFVRMLESRRIRIKQDDMKDVLDKLMGPLSKHYSVEATATALQNEFENLVLENKKFHAMACKAYISWIRFYSSYPRDMREIFNRKELHLGHYAKSFALRDPPQKIGGIGKTLREKEPQKQQHNNRLSNDRPAKEVQKKQNGIAAGRQHKPEILKRSRMLNVSEYGSGLEPTKKMKKS